MPGRARAPPPAPPIAARQDRSACHRCCGAPEHDPGCVRSPPRGARPSRQPPQGPFPLRESSYIDGPPARCEGHPTRVRRFSYLQSHYPGSQRFWLAFCATEVDALPTLLEGTAEQVVPVLEVLGVRVLFSSTWQANPLMGKALQTVLERGAVSLCHQPCRHLNGVVRTNPHQQSTDISSLSATGTD